MNKEQERLQEIEATTKGIRSAMANALDGNYSVPDAANLARAISLIERQYKELEAFCGAHPIVEEDDKISATKYLRAVLRLFDDNKRIFLYKDGFDAEKCIKTALNVLVESLQRERDERGNPQPLTLKELSSMEGKPAYNINNNAWCVIDYIDEVDELCTIIHFTDGTELDFEQDYLCLYAAEPKGDAHDKP